jgi:Bacterial protein of unknown function (Gcw_chp)
MPYPNLWVRLLIITLFAAPLCSPSARAEESPVAPDTGAKAESDHAMELSYDATIASSYIFQGIDYSYGQSVIQPNATAAWRGLSANFWGNVQARAMATNEIDLSIKYGREMGKVSAAAGYLNLRYPNRDWDPSQEFFVDLAYAVPLNPSLSVHYDFDAGEGSYTTLGLKHELPNHLTLGTNLFYQSHYYAMTGIVAAEFKLAASFPIGGLTLTHSGSYFTTWENGDFRGEAAIPAKWLVAINVAR